MRKLKEEFPMGTQVGNWTVLSEGRWNNEVLVECGCADHTQKFVRCWNMASGGDWCCGCVERYVTEYKEQYMDECPVGFRYGYWVVLGKGDREMTWKCRHNSGKKLDIFAPLLLSGRTVELDGKQESVLPGQKFGHIIAVHEADRDPKGRLQWYCRDDREATTIMITPASNLIRPSELLSGDKKGIGVRVEDLTTQTFGFLTPIKPAPPERRKSCWYCICRCGRPDCKSLNPETKVADVLISVRTDYLKDGRRKTCNSAGRRGRKK